MVTNMMIRPARKTTRVVLLLSFLVVFFITIHPALPVAAGVIYAPTGQTFPEGHAIVLGTDYLPYYNPGMGTAGSDVSNVTTALVNAGFDPAEIYALGGWDARKSRLSSTLATITSHVTAGDMVVVYLSGEVGDVGVNPTVEACDIRTPVPYPTNYNNYWTITHPGAAYMRVRFQWLDVEKTYDWAYVANGTGEQKHCYDGVHDLFWSDWVPGDTIRVGLHSDYTITGSGFYVSAYEAAVALEQGFLLADRETPAGLTPGNLAAILNETLGNCPPHEELVILECDNAGIFLESLAAPGRAVWAACMAGEFVHSWPGSNVGAFTGMWSRAITRPYDFLNADQDSDGNVTGAEAYHFAWNKVIMAQLNQQPCAQPTSGGNGAWDFDADNDGLLNWEEVRTHGCNPSVTDTDGDGWGDWEEVYKYHTNPAAQDTDGDGYDDSTDPDPLDAGNPRAWNDILATAGAILVWILVAAGIFFAFIFVAARVHDAWVSRSTKQRNLPDMSLIGSFPPTQQAIPLTSTARQQVLPQPRLPGLLQQLKAKHTRRHEEKISWAQAAETLLDAHREIAAHTKALLSLRCELAEVISNKTDADREIEILQQNAAYQEGVHMEFLQRNAEEVFATRLAFRNAAKMLWQPKVLRRLDKYHMTEAELRRVKSVTSEDFPMSDEGRITFARCLRLLHDVIDANPLVIPPITMERALESIHSFWQYTDPRRDPLRAYVVAKQAAEQAMTRPECADVLKLLSAAKSRRATLKVQETAIRAEKRSLLTKRRKQIRRIETSAFFTKTKKKQLETTPGSNPCHE